MDTTTLSLMAMIAIFLYVAVHLLRQTLDRREQTARLQSQFGSEYQRTVRQTDDEGEAEKELAARLLHAQSLDILPLTKAQKDEFRSQWRMMQERFTHDPVGAIGKAHHLITRAMDAKGYPAESFEQMAADLSVGFPDHVQSYRDLHMLGARTAYKEINRETMWHAMLKSQRLLEELLDSDIPALETLNPKAS